MLPSHFQCGERTAGYITRIRVDGFNGIAAISWVGAARTILVYSVAGELSGDISIRSIGTASATTYPVVADNGRLCCIGHMTHAVSDSARVLRRVRAGYRNVRPTPQRDSMGRDRGRIVS